MAESDSRRSASAAKQLAAISSLVSEEDVRKSPAELITKLAGDVLAKSQGGSKQAGQASSLSVAQLLDRFERWAASPATAAPPPT